MGASDPLLSPHPLLVALGARTAERQRAYRALFDEMLDDAFVDELRAATNGGWAIGSERFKAQIAAALRRRVTPAPAGRPRKPPSEGGQLILI